MLWIKKQEIGPLVTCYSLLATILLFTVCWLLTTGVYAFCFEDAGKEYGINPSLLKSIAQIESNLNPKAMNKNKNGSVDIGLMQINSFWIKTLGLDYNKLFSDSCYNTMIGAKVLKQCIDRYGYTWEAVGCYNATSTPQKVKYSWKIYNVLVMSNELRVASNKMGKKEVPNKNSYLFFSVRDMSNSEINTDDSSLITRHPSLSLEAR